MRDKTKAKAKKVWVEIEVNKFNEGLTVFRGQMLRSELEGWATGELVDCAIKLENTYWFLRDSICFLGKENTKAKYYTGEIYIRYDTIMLIYLLKEDSYPGEKTISEGKIFPFPQKE